MIYAVIYVSIKYRQTQFILAQISIIIDLCYFGLGRGQVSIQYKIYEMFDANIMELLFA